MGNHTLKNVILTEKEIKKQFYEDNDFKSMPPMAKGGSKLCGIKLALFLLMTNGTHFGIAHKMTILKTEIAILKRMDGEK